MAKIQERLSGKIASVNSTVEGMQITIQLPVLEPKEISEEEIRRRELNMKLKAYHKLLGVNYQLKTAVKQRMERCTTNLAKHLDSITFSDSNVVVYEGGHFSYPAYAAMQELVQDLDIEVANGVADRYDKVFSTPMKRLQLLKAAQMFNFTLLTEDELEWLFGYLTEQATRIEH
jgi:hypothetical protein